MTRLTLIIVLFFYSTIAYTQQNILIFKKGNKTIDRFYKGTLIAFQLKNRQWQKGEITTIRKDSFYISPMVVHYSLMGTDTVHYNVLGFAFSEVFAMPKKGILIDHINGHFQISTSGGHVHWYWIKSGWIFRVGAAGYAALNVANGLIKNEFSFKGSKLGIAAGVFLFGTLLKYIYKPVLPLGKKYHLEMIRLSR
jgi:hypothetical protein